MRIKNNIRLYSHGFTLVEVLIATVILAIGLLGMAGIQIKGIRSTESSFLRSAATNIANDFAERMLANSRAAQNNIGDKKDTDKEIGSKAMVDNQYFKYKDKQIDSTDFACPATPGNCRGAICNPSEMAKYDIESWICGMPTSDNKFTGSISQLLPGGAAKVDCVDSDPEEDLPPAQRDPCSPGSTHQITVSWVETSPVSGKPVNQSVTVNTVP